VPEPVVRRQLLQLVRSHARICMPCGAPAILRDRGSEVMLQKNQSASVYYLFRAVPARCHRYGRWHDANEQT